MPQPSSKLQILLLAAGIGRRMQRDKATLPWGSRTLVEHVAAQFPPDVAEVRIIANPANAAAIQAMFPEASNSINATPDADMLSSVRVGVAASDPDGGALCIHPLDVFAVMPDLVRMLYTAHCAEPDHIHAPLVSTPDQPRRAHPIIFPWRFVPLIDRIPANRGLNWLLRECVAEVREHFWPDERLLADLDTPEEYERHRPH